MLIVQSNNYRKSRICRRIYSLIPTRTVKGSPSTNTDSSQEPETDKVRAKPWAFVIVAALLAGIGVGGYSLTSEDSIFAYNGSSDLYVS